jgi:hypothetical protein
MAQRFAGLEPAHRDFIAAQPLFFVGTAAPTGRVNLSPKGMDSLRVLGPNRILWLNVTGSGNETAAHLAEDPRMTLMWCSFDARPLILRAYGRARCVHRGAPDWAGRAAQLPDLPGARQILELDIDLVQSSCGYAVPLMERAAPRDTLRAWAARKSPAELEAYWSEKNARSLDGRPTGIDAASAVAR